MNKPKIVVTSPLNLSPEQISRLKQLGETTVYDTFSASGDEWIERTKDAEIICSGKSGLTEKIYERKNVFYSLPFVAVGWIDKDKLKESGSTVSYCPGCNSSAVSEWIVSMTLLLMRKFNRLVNTQEVIDKVGSPDYHGLMRKKACILGQGNVGSKVGKIYEAMGMNVTYFNRGDNLIEKVRDCNIVVNTLSSNESTDGLLDKNFYNSFSGNTYFVTVTSSKIYNPDLMLSALKSGKLLGVADDCGSILPGDIENPYYKSLIETPGVFATPHTSYQSDVALRISNDMMIDNVEAYIKSSPINLLV